MSDLVTAIGLLFFIEDFIAIFPSRIKNMLKIIETMSENKLLLRCNFLNNRIYYNLVYEKLNEND